MQSKSRDQILETLELDFAVLVINVLRSMGVWCARKQSEFAPNCSSSVRE